MAKITFYFMNFAFAVATFATLAWLCSTRFGLAMNAIRNDEEKAEGMDLEILLVDEQSIGVEPRFIDMVFEILDDLQYGEGKTIVMVEQNARKVLEFTEFGDVLVSGELAKAGPGHELLEDLDVGRLFLGG